MFHLLSCSCADLHIGCSVLPTSLTVPPSTLRFHDPHRTFNTCTAFKHLDQNSHQTAQAADLIVYFFRVLIGRARCWYILGRCHRASPHTEFLLNLTSTQPHLLDTSSADASAPPSHSHLCQPWKWKPLAHVHKHRAKKATRPCDRHHSPND